MSSLLEKIHSGRQNRPRRVLVYGTGGIGKSTFAADAPSPIFITTEDGVGDIETDSFPKAKSFDDVMQAIKVLCTEEHNYETVVIDSLDEVEQLIWSHRCQKDQKENIEKYGYAKGYKIVLGEWRELLKGLEYLRNERGMAVVLIAHSVVERFENPETEPYDRHTPALHKHASALIQYWCDEILFASYKVHARVDETGVNTKRARGLGGDARVLRTVEKPYCIAKNRLGLPDEMQLAWSEYESYINRNRKVSPQPATAAV